MVIKQSCVYGYREVHCNKKQMIFIETLQKMLILEIMNQIDHCLKKKNKKVIRLMKYDLGGNLTKLVGVRAKTYNQLINGGSENKKTKSTKRCVIKRKLKFENYKNCLEATQFENKINYLEKNKINRQS